MRFPYLLFFIVGLLGAPGAFGQSAVISGTVTDEKNTPLVGATVRIQEVRQGTSTGAGGRYQLIIPAGVPIQLEFSFLGFAPKVIPLQAIPNDSLYLNVVLSELAEQLGDVEVKGKGLKDPDISAVHRIDAKATKSLPSAFGDFNKILVTLPGVSSNNELSSAYSVRGGNFDENLVYVNDIPVYRPFLANAGQQEGLSFVNPDMVQDIEFYAGGWEAKYGDKLSSSLNIEYKTPDSLEGVFTVGLLGATAYTGGKSQRMSYLFGARHRDSRYLLGTLETKGQYFPTYTDFQGLLDFDLTARRLQTVNKTRLSWLVSYGRNRYLTFPSSQVTEFGSVQQTFRMQTAFEGQELLSYDTYQTGFRLTHRFGDLWRTHLIGSALRTSEKEQFDVEGAYRLCDVNTNPGSSSFNDCVVVRGIGTNYAYGRNELDASLYTVENRHEYLLSVNHLLEAGAGLAVQRVADDIREYRLVDSADYVSLTSSIFNSLQVNATQFYGYVQHTSLWADSVHAISSGVRLTYWSYNQQLLVSPRITYRLAAKKLEGTTFKFSAGYYQQPPFYRELRDLQGTIQPDVLAQRSIHWIASMTRLFKMWDRPFFFSMDLYHKQLFDIVPYDIENVRLRYYGENLANGFAQGVDMRINGEFVRGTQSWVSLSFLRTQEDLNNDFYTVYRNAQGDEVFPGTPDFADVSDTLQVARGIMRRPMDQRINLAMYFEDHMPNDPTLRVYVSTVFGSGYPFGPPDAPRYRNVFSGDEYYRVDLGLSKMFDISTRSRFTNLWVRVEVLNALGADNTLSYSWITDVYDNQFAIPNSLSARFFNLKLSVEI